MRCFRLFAACMFVLLLAACNVNPPSLRGTWREAQGSLPGLAEATTLLTGGGTLMASRAFSFQHYFEYQVEEARKISQ